MTRSVRLAVLCVFAVSAVVPAFAQDSTASSISALGSSINTTLEQQGADFRLDYAEYLTADDSGEAGQTVFFNNRGNKQLTSHFVAGDPRRFWNVSNAITYTIDQAEGAVDGLTQAQTNAAISRAMATWGSVTCSSLAIEARGNAGGDIGHVEAANGLGGRPYPNIYADVTHAGWLPGGILPSNVIAVTFTFVWVGPTGPTDIDNDGRSDTAFREILYNNVFIWRINASMDVETIALHEAGHGLSQGHFGSAFLTSENGKLHFAPRAVMNAAYSGVQQNPAGTDNGGHCSIWASWPN